VDNPSAPAGKAEKYARVERERRWLLGDAPSPDEASAEAEITDLYFSGTRLRLRRMVDRRGGGPTIYKLTQKVPGGEATGLITNTYLSEDEYQLLARLPGDELRKVRYSVPPFGVDVFLPPLDGLILAEAEFETDDAMIESAAPPTAIAEVTADERFTGGRLAVTSAAELAAYLAELSSRSRP
jgi:CYTH domain-containing protein